MTWTMHEGDLAIQARQLRESFAELYEYLRRRDRALVWARWPDSREGTLVVADSHCFDINNPAGGDAGSWTGLS